MSPGVANDTNATVAEARHLWEAVARPNVMIKVPGTAAGVPAVRALTAEGINVNITLLFGREMYEAVAGAYIEGLEDRARRPGGESTVDNIASVASFFVSRIDTSVDKLTGRRRSQRATGAERQRLERLYGKVAIANARLAYQSYKRIFAGPRWEALAAKGARKQRLLWASTSVKNPRYRDVMYVEELIGPDTINTMPAETLTAFRDHGRRAPAWNPTSKARSNPRRSGGGRHLFARGHGRSDRRRDPEVPGALRQDDRRPRDPLRPSPRSPAAGEDLIDNSGSCEPLPTNPLA